MDTRTATRWSVDTTLSTARFAVRNFGLKTVRGTVPITAAWVDVDPDGRPVAVHAELDLAALDSGNARRDADLAKPRLLDTGRYPTLTFDAGPGARTADGGWTLPGRLAGHGTVAEVQLRVEGGADGFTATAGLDRTALAVRAPRVLIGRYVDISISGWLRPAPGAR